MKPQNVLFMPYPKISDGSGQRQIDEVYLKLIDIAGIEEIPTGKNYVEVSRESAIRTEKFEAPEIYNVPYKKDMKVRIQN
jgi:hypothetical protein